MRAYTTVGTRRVLGLCSSTLFCPASRGASQDPYLTVRWKKFSDEGKTVHFGWRYHGEFISCGKKRIMHSRVRSPNVLPLPGGLRHDRIAGIERSATLDAVQCGVVCGPVSCSPCTIRSGVV